MKYIIILTFFSGMLSCTPEKVTTQIDAGGVVVEKPFIWNSSISDGTLTIGLYTGYIIDGKGVLSVAMRKPSDPKVHGHYYLQLKDLKTGENIWTWDEFITGIGNLQKSVRIYNGKMLVHDGPYDYVIDTQTGKTIWKQRTGRPGAIPPVTSLGNKFYFTGNSVEADKISRTEEVVYVGDLNTGDVKELLKPDYSLQYAYNAGGYFYVGSLMGAHAFTKEGVDYLVVPHIEMSAQARYTPQASFFGLYNLSENKWVYQRAPLSLEKDGATPSRIPIVDGDRVYMTSLNSVGCYELMTGRRIWQKRLTEVETSFSDFIKVGDRLIANGENATLYCLDAATGNTLWTQISSAFTSDLYHQDGVIYWIITKKLGAVDLQTGRLLWRMECPDGKVENRPDSWYTGFVTGIPAQNGKKGKIFASTNLNVYCFEAIN